VEIAAKHSVIRAVVAACALVRLRDDGPTKLFIHRLVDDNTFLKQILEKH
jgi:hypothetical protein